ncbi:N-acetylglucosaminyl transferase component-domain-containing protein [Mycena sp. CBHHK59/15]|nr:N-acetylglucosaminyl transferase component-domain-containing protein [Mycena sp. CBHHK59/15]
MTVPGKSCPWARWRGEMRKKRGREGEARKDDVRVQGPLDGWSRCHVAVCLPNATKCVLAGGCPALWALLWLDEACPLCRGCPPGRLAEIALDSLYTSSEWARLSDACAGRPVLLGKCNFGPWEYSRHPSLDFRDLEGYNIIYYHRHTATSLRFYSLETAELGTDASPSHKTRNSMYSTSLEHDFTRARRPESASGMSDVVINRFNSAKTIDTILQKRAPGQLELSKYILRIMEASLCIPKRIVSLARLSFPRSLGYLKDFSSTLQQLDVRVEQTDFLTYEVEPLRQHDLTSISVYSARYTSFFNTVWLILNDITIGSAFGSFLCENHIILARMLNSFVEAVAVDWIRWALGWLNSWPAGLKLNTELSRFYSHTFIGLVAMWGYILQRGAPHLPAILYVFGVLSASGMTMAISLFSDLLALCTVHIYVCYLISNFLYAKLLRTAGSLWNLFRGKRYNVLRNRTDSWEYDTDQLLFGTILFTLLAFLFPTVLAYYSLFAMMRLGTILLNACLETQLAFMNHFPLFALMLRAKDPWRLPGRTFSLRFDLRFLLMSLGGIYFAVEYSPQSEHPFLVVKNQPVPFSSIFFQYIQLWSRLAAHYNPLRLLWCVLKGEYLVAIPRYSMRYNKIPAE